MSRPPFAKIINCEIIRNIDDVTIDVPLKIRISILMTGFKYEGIQYYFVQDDFCGLTWVDQKVLKLVVYLFQYTAELHQTYTVPEYKVTIFLIC